MQAFAEKLKSVILKKYKQRIKEEIDNDSDFKESFGTSENYLQIFQDYA